METNQTPKQVTEARFRAVAGTINYTRPIAERLHIDVRDFSRTNMQFEPHEMRIRDARDIQDRLSLDREGFVLREHRSAVAESRDLALLARDYHAEMVPFLQELTGARDVLPQRTGLLLRFGERSKEQGVKPARSAHLDYTTPWAHQFVALVTGWEQATLRPYGRFAIYQTWRATSTPPQDNTLAFCDGRSVENADTMDFKAFDSAAPDALNVAHTAFDDPSAPADAVPRSSIEARFVAFFD